LAAGLALIWSIVTIPFVVSLRSLLRQKGGNLALSATILASFGVLLLAYGIYLYITALFSISAVSNLAPSTAEATYQAAIWANLMCYLSDPPLMALGLGQFLFGWLAWKSDILPKWFGGVGMLGGIAGLLTLAVYQTSVFALVQTGAFAIWGLTIGIIFLRGRGGSR
jgi:hypothetical protein